MDGGIAGDEGEVLENIKQQADGTVGECFISMKKLRQRLQEELVSKAAIQDSENIMRIQFAALQNQLVLLKQKQSLLLNTLR